MNRDVRNECCSQELLKTQRATDYQSYLVESNSTRDCSVKRFSAVIHLLSGESCSCTLMHVQIEWVSFSARHWTTFFFFKSNSIWTFFFSQGFNDVFLVNSVITLLKSFQNVYWLLKLFFVCFRIITYCCYFASCLCACLWFHCAKKLPTAM